jgi:hypothetical protein
MTPPRLSPAEIASAKAFARRVAHGIGPESHSSVQGQLRTVCLAWVQEMDAQPIPMPAKTIPLSAREGSILKEREDS